MNVGPWLRYFLAIGAMTSSMGTYVAYLYTCSSALAAVAEKKYVPKFFTRKFERTHTPYAAALFYAFFSLVLSFFDFNALISLETILYCVHILILCTLLPHVRYREREAARRGRARKLPPPHKRTFRLPFGFYGTCAFSLPPAAIAVANIVTAQWPELGASAVLIVGIGVAFKYMQKKDYWT